MVKGDGHIPLGTLLKDGSTNRAAVVSFPIVRTNSYGRMMISAQMNTHERLIRNAHARTDNRISKVALDQMDYNRKMEKWKPGYNELQKKATDDEILARLIRDAKHRCDERLDAHVRRFQKNRAKNPKFKPGWLEAYCNAKTMAVHEELLAKAKPRIDAKTPAKAWQFRNFLRGCKFTRGGFERQDTGKKTKIKLPPVEELPGVPNLKEQQRAQRQELEHKYAMMLFESQMARATSDDVRLLYAKSNRLEVQDHYEAARARCQTLPITDSEDVAQGEKEPQIVQPQLQPTPRLHQQMPPATPDHKEGLDCTLSPIPMSPETEVVSSGIDHSQSAGEIVNP